MRFERAILIEAGEEEARAKAARALASFGFVPEGGEGLRFRRGSRRGSLLSMFSPDRWEAAAAVDLAQAARGTVAAMRIVVNSRGQVTTAAERGFWEAQYAEIAGAMTAETVASRPSTTLKRKARNENIAALLILVGLTLLFAVLAGIRWHSLRAYAGGAATGLAAGVAFLMAWLKLRLG